MHFVGYSIKTLPSAAAALDKKRHCHGSSAVNDGFVKCLPAGHSEKNIFFEKSRQRKYFFFEKSLTSASSRAFAKKINFLRYVYDAAVSNHR